VDLVLRRDGKTTLVQCKRWTGKSVGVSVVRELYGIMAAEKADEGILVTTSSFTQDTKSFVVGKPIQLIDGTRLLPRVRSAQKGALMPESQVPRPSSPS
jgi:restriction system protein